MFIDILIILSMIRLDGQLIFLQNQKQEWIIQPGDISNKKEYKNCIRWPFRRRLLRIMIYSSFSLEIRNLQTQKILLS